MLAYAFKSHRRGLSSNASLRGESFVEWCIQYACCWDEQGQLLLDAVYQGQDNPIFRRLKSQIVDSLKPGSRPDLEIFYSLATSEQHSILVELKIDAALTSAQKKSAYADVFVCSTPQKSRISLHHESDPQVRLLSWSELFEEISQSPRAENTDLSLWRMICSLGEDLARDARDLQPLSSPGALFDQKVADNYSTVMTLMQDILEVLGHPPLFPPPPKMKGDIGLIKSGGDRSTSLIFTPESMSSPISVGFINYNKYLHILDAGAQGSYESPKTLTEQHLPVREGAIRPAGVFFQNELSAIKWQSQDSAVGRYLHSFLQELRDIFKENADVSMHPVPLSDKHVGYLLQRGDRRFFALFDAQRWARMPAAGPFVVRR
ncbi:hypothetical protein [Arthrobacter sp. HMWF013]|uniref:hypothetical protein n=1 Tax=Arthrobacter sp. HMWF013 TaxID=2056849 RepID=UPI000D3D6460|nr:hypothetical protein [Arthrobacter sp. HMWF013]PTT69215.1 hypothetical protein DBR22_04395 [Arthrobacter sp. HMWF013]